ncbi:MAG TPA: arylamine N-acetyltransferase [Caulifigura sp.]|nr:arylamine N-acetyltransferase [Caulifigura sp.]
MTDNDLAAYFRRVGHDGDRSPTLQTLSALHRRHTESIPFENLNSLLKRPVRLDLPWLVQKLIHERRGGYCYEHNLLFRSVLERLGFQVTGLAARVLWNAPEGVVTPRTHMVLRVDLDGRSWLADVGFGGQVMTAPLLLEPHIEQSTPHEPFRLVPWNNELVQQSLIRGGWMATYRFDLQPQELSDYEVASWYVSTHPESIFLNCLLSSRTAPGVRYALMNNELSIHRTGADTEKRTLKSAAEMKHALENEIGINLPDTPELEPLLARLAGA